jgi:hypothetical protein
MLGGILAVQLAIFKRTPQQITVAELKAAGSQKTEMMQNIPLVSVSGDVGVDVQNTVEVKNQPFTDLDVDVQNTPLQVNVEHSN